MKITKILVLSRKNINISYANKRLWIMDHVVLNWLLISRRRNHCHWTYSFGVTQLRNWYFWRLECLLPYFSVGSCASHGGIEQVPSNGSSVRDGVFHPVRSERLRFRLTNCSLLKTLKGALTTWACCFPIGRDSGLLSKIARVRRDLSVVEFSL